MFLKKEGLFVNGESKLLMLSFRTQKFKISCNKIQQHSFL